MGSKKSLATTVADTLTQITSNTCVDLFSGMCNVGAALADTRQVIANDIQHAAAFVARTLLATPEPPVPPPLDMIVPLVRRNHNALINRFSREWHEEKYWLFEANTGDWAKYLHWCNSLPHVGSDPNLVREVRVLRAEPRTPYRLFTLTFANSYFGLDQSMEIDSIRFSIDFLHGEGSISTAQARWMLLGLLQTISHVSSSPGHFAQYLNVKGPNSFEEIRRQRRRSILGQFQSELIKLQAPGSTLWRRQNRVLNHDAFEAVGKLPGYGRIGCIYADPPYTDAQYSRYYHVLETLVLYDYPESEFKGRYRSDRYKAPFGRVSTVENAFDQLAASIANIKTPLLLSYPSTGLLGKVGLTPEEILSRHFSKVELIMGDRHHHSTLGGSGGKAKVEVQEYLILATI